MQVVFSLSQLQYFQFSTVVKLYKKNKKTQKFCPLALIFHLAPYLIFTATLKSILPESLVLVTKKEQFGVKSAHIRTTIKQFLNKGHPLIILNTKTRLSGHGYPTSFSWLRLFPHLLVKIQNSFLCMC